MAVVCVAMVEAFKGAVLVAQVGTGTTTAAVVNVLPLVRSQLTAGPLAFLGTIYQLYNEPAISETALYVGVATVAVAEAGGVAPVHKYTS